MARKMHIEQRSCITGAEKSDSTPQNHILLIAPTHRKTLNAQGYQGEMGRTAGPEWLGVIVLPSVPAGHQSASSEAEKYTDQRSTVRRLVD